MNYTSFFTLLVIYFRDKVRNIKDEPETSYTPENKEVIKNF